MVWGQSLHLRLRISYRPHRQLLHTRAGDKGEWLRVALLLAGPPFPLINWLRTFRQQQKPRRARFSLSSNRCLVSPVATAP